MASSFIEYHKNGFWIRDGILEPAASYLYITILDHRPEEGWLTEMGTHIKHNSWGYFNGFMQLGFDKFLTDTERCSTFVHIIDTSIALLQQKKEALDLVQDIGMHLDAESVRIYSGPGTVERDRVVKVLVYLKRLLEGETIDPSPMSATMMI